jgi:hypothetical protein
MQIIGASSKSKTFKKIKFGSLLPAENFPKNLNFPNSAGPALVQKVVFNAEKLTRASRSRFAIGTLSGPRGPMMALMLSLGSAFYIGLPTRPTLKYGTLYGPGTGRARFQLRWREKRHIFLLFPSATPWSNLQTNLSARIRRRSPKISSGRHSMFASKVS